MSCLEPDLIPAAPMEWRTRLLNGQLLNIMLQIYCTPVERTFSVQITPFFPLHVFFSSYKSTQELGSFKRRVLAVPGAGSLLWLAS